MILLTGGTGLLGSHIAYELVSKGQKIRALKRKESSTALTEKIFRFYNSDAQLLLDKIEWVDGDVLDLGALEDALEGITHVYHAAALVSFHPKEKEKMLQVNIEGTANVVNLAVHAGVKKICHISSIAALGVTIDQKLIDEDVWWKNDPGNSWYAISKYGAEREVWRVSEEGMDVVILNPAFILGPGDEKRTSSEVFGAMKKGNSWYTLGENGYVDARDVAMAAVKLMESEIKNQRFVLSAENLSYRDFFDKILAAFAQPKTKRLAGKFLLALSWRGEKLMTLLTGENPRVTRETALAALQLNRYDGTRITKQLDFKYRDVDNSIREIAEFYK
ncbi:MAG: NAD-dependent epimerase/dehydratase family protein [Bacteroidia bacterium]